MYIQSNLQEYLQKLMAIRQQNYQERKRIQQKAQVFQKPPEKSRNEAPGKAVRPTVPQLSLQPQDKPAPFDAEERRRKIAALKVRMGLVGTDTGLHLLFVMPM